MTDPETRPKGQDEAAEILEAVDRTDAADSPAEPVKPQPSRRVDAAPPPRRGGFFGTLLGGVIAAALGFGLARYAVPEGWPLGGADSSPDQVAQQAETLTALQAEVAQLEEELAKRPAEDRVAALESAISEVKAAVAALPEPAASTAETEQRLAELENRLSRLESTPMTEGGVTPQALAAFQADLAAVKAQVDAQKGAGAAVISEIETAAETARARLAEAEAVAKATANRAALAQVGTAIDSGQPFSAALAELESAGLAIPPILTESAQGGVPTLTTLQQAFPEAARQALEASLRADMGESFGDRLTSFFRSQTGARSLTPREGTDPDAVLSRAESALKQGALPEALAELAGLPADGQAAMADWIALAEHRIATAEAVQALASAPGME